MSDNTNTNVIATRPYGAREIKKAIEENTFRGLMVTAGIMITMFVASCAFTSEAVELKNAPVLPGKGTTILFGGNIEEVPELILLPPPPLTVIHGLASVVGTPVPVLGMELEEDVIFANTDEMHLATSTAGDGIMPTEEDIAATIENNEKIEITVREDEITAVEKEIWEVQEAPKFDLESLSKNVIYPEMAIKARIEGTVLVRVLVDRTGKTSNPEIVRTDNSTLNNAAVSAILKTTFIPAIQNNSPVSCRILIPVEFRLN